MVLPATRSPLGPKAGQRAGPDSTAPLGGEIDSSLLTPFFPRGMPPVNGSVAEVVIEEHLAAQFCVAERSSTGADGRRRSLSEAQRTRYARFKLFRL